MNIKHIFGLPTKEEKATEVRNRIVNEANEKFNIIKNDNGVYLTYMGVRISSPEDNEYDLLTRLFALRKQYVEARVNEY